MSMTVARLHKVLGELIAKGHGRKPICVNKPTFYDPRESDGANILELHGVEGPRWIYTMDDDGGVKINRDGTEGGKRIVVLHGCRQDDPGSAG